MDSPSLHDTVAAPSADVAAAQPRSSSRRRLFGAGLGVVAALSPAFTGAAAASPPDSEADSDGAAAPAAPTTTSAPKRPTDADLEQLRYAQTIELAARDLYDAALKPELLDDANRPLFTAIREAHEAYAHSLAGVIGTTAPGEADAALVRQHRSGFSSGSVSSIAGVAAELENSLAATHRSTLGELRGTDAVALVAAIVPIEGRHAAVLSSLAGRTGLDDAILNDAEPLQPED